MSKKPAEAAPQAAAAAATVVIPVVPQELVDEAVTRFAPFVFTFSTETRENIEFAAVVAQLQKDPLIGPNLFIVDKSEACHAVSVTNPATVADPSFAQLVTDVKAGLPALTAADAVLTPDQSNLAALCVRQKVIGFAVIRENARREEQRLIHQQHLELVERFVEEGMKPQDAERAAQEEEQATALQNAAAADGGAVDERQVAFVLLRGGFPASPHDLAALAKCNILVHAILSVNTLAKLGIKKEAESAVDAKGAAAKGAKKTTAADTKKPEPKKGGKAAADVTVVVVESLAVALKKEVIKLTQGSRLAPPVSHPLLQSEVWVYNVPTVETAAIDDAGLKVHDLAQPEIQTLQLITDRVVQLEQYFDKYKTWCASKTLRNVTKLQTRDEAAQLEAAAAAAEVSRLAAEAAKNAAAPPPKGSRAAAKPPVAGKGAVEEAPKEDTTVTQVVSSTLPKTVAELPFAAEAYNAVMHAIPSPLCSVPSILRAVTTQIAYVPPVAAVAAPVHAPAALPAEPAAHAPQAAAILSPRRPTGAATTGAAGTVAPVDSGVTPRVAVGSITPRFAIQNSENVALLKRDVADYADFMLAQLDGNQKHVFEAARIRRLHPAAASAAASHEEKADPSVLTVHNGITLVAPVGDQSPLELKFSQDSLGVLLPQVVDENAVHGNAATLESLSKACESVVLATRGAANPSDKKKVASVPPITHWEVLTDRQCQERLQSACFFEDNASSGTVTSLSDGTKIVVVDRPFDNENRRRWSTTWTTFHGVPTFAQWLHIAEYVDAERLHYFPPPRDEDDDDEPAAAVTAAADEEEEEEEEQEEEEDENGEIIVKAKKKREKKVVFYDIDYVNYNEQQTQELRRRNTLEHVMRTMNDRFEESLYSNNHTTASIYEEEHAMFPDDGSVIVTNDMEVNTSGVNCTVQSKNCVFGFRASKQAAQHPPVANAKVVASGVRAFITVDNGVTLTAEVTLSKHAAAAPSAPGSTLPTPRDAQNASTAVNPTVSLPALAPEEDATPVTTVVIATKESTLSIDSTAGCVTLTRPASEQSPNNRLLAYSGTKESIKAVGAETHRTVLANGTIVVYYTSGCVQHLKCDGSWATFSPSNGWLHCNARGQRLARTIAGSVKELAPAASSTRTDAVSHAKITHRDDGTNRVDFIDGERSVITHSNGTQFWVFPQRVEVHGGGYPRIIFPRSFLAGGDNDNAEITFVFSSNRAFATWVPHRRVVFGHNPSAVQAIISFDSLRMHVVPSPDRAVNEYVVDYAFGGLRTRDAASAYHVTPFGRTRSKPIDEEHPPTPTDLTVKHTIEVFVTQREVIAQEFTDAMKAMGHVAFHGALHLLQHGNYLADDAEWVELKEWASTRPLSLPQSQKEQQTATQLKKLLLSSNSKQSSTSTPMVIAILPGNRGALAAMCERDLQSDVRSILLTADLVLSNVHEVTLNQWNGIAVCVAPSNPQDLKFLPKVPALAAPPRDSTHTSFETLNEFSSALLQKRRGNPAAVETPSPVLQGRYFVVRGARNGAELPLDTLLSSVQTSFNGAVTALVESLPPSLRDTKSDAGKPTAAANHRQLAGRSEESVTRVNTIHELHKNVNSAHPSQSVYKYWSAHEPCLDSEAEKNQRLKEALHKEKADLQERVAKAEAAAVAGSSKAGGQKTGESNEGAAVPSTAVAVVPPYVPLYQNPQGSMNNNGRIGNTGTTPYHAGATVGSTSSRKLSKPRIVATPGEAEFGTLMEGFRYTTNIQLTNISAVSSRYRVVFESQEQNAANNAKSGATQDATVPDGGASQIGERRIPSRFTWVSVEYPKVALAPGMSCVVELELDGYQPIGETNIVVVVMYDGGRCEVPLHVGTRAGTDRPVSQQRSNVRMIGPSPLRYQPGSVASSKREPNPTDGNESD